MDTLNLHRCPLCRAVGVIHPGEPPSNKMHNYYNRCIGHALTGFPGSGGIRNSRTENSWYGCASNGSSLCGFPMTTDAGIEIVDGINQQEYMDFTRKPFSVQALRTLILPRQPR
jgi:hypothetical protein